MKTIKTLLKENTLNAIIFGIISMIWLSPIAILFLVSHFLIETPIMWIINKFKKYGKKDKNKKN